MSVELLHTLSLVSYILASVFLLIAIALFFLLGVPSLFGDITGATARKAIESIRQQNESTGNKAYKPSPINAARGKVTDRISPSGSLLNRTSGLGINVGTEKISTSRLAPTTEETTLLENGQNETTILSETVTYGETVILSVEELTTSAQEGSKVSESKFSVEAEISFTGSAEIIE